MGKRRAEQAVDLYDYVLRSQRLPRAAPRAADVDRDLVIRVQDDWPDAVPVTEAELRVIEGHLGEVLDALFGPKP